MAAIAAVRLFILPVIAGVIVIGTGIAGLWEAIDPLFVLVLLLIHATPTAPAVQALATSFHSHEADTAALVFWQSVFYIVTLPPMLAGAIALIDAAPLKWRHGEPLAPSNDTAFEDVAAVLGG